MDSRLLTFTGATSIDAGVDYLREEALPILEAQHGFRGVSASADRAGNLMTILSLWATEADRSASDSALGKAREAALKLVGGGLEIESFEEVVQVITKPPVPGCVLNVVRVRMEPASIQGNIEWFKESIVLTITSQSASARCATWSTGSPGAPSRGVSSRTRSLRTPRSPESRSGARPPKVGALRSSRSTSARHSCRRSSRPCCRRSSS